MTVVVPPTPTSRLGAITPLGAWPTQNSPEKKRAQRLASEAFQAYVRTQPGMEVLRIRFENTEILAACSVR